jgi:hypothetical protein
MVFSVNRAHYFESIKSNVAFAELHATQHKLYGADGMFDTETLHLSP